MSNMKSVTLQNPIKRGESEITELKIRKPKSGELRGLKTSEILQMDINTHAKLLPRICPDLTEPDFYNLETEDLTNIQVAVVGFFVNSDS